MKITDKIVQELREGTDSFRELAVIYIVSLFISALLFSVYEDKSVADSFWWAVITGLTIGYGDLYAETMGGQLLTVAWAHFMVLILLPLFVTRVVTTAMKNRHEFTHEEQEEILSYIREQRDQQDG